jgi:steroid 5-alpha reductase family enzyme
MDLRDMDRYMDLVTAIVIASVAMIGVMTAAWATARASVNAGWVDVFWTLGTGTVGAWAALTSFAHDVPIDWRRTVVACLVVLWSLRLALHIALRVARGPEDARYVALRAEWRGDFHRRLYRFLIAQALCSVVLVAAIYVAAHNPNPDVGPLDVAGVFVLVVAIAGETLADRQLAAFKADPGNRGRVCDAGLWAFSRHPNYFFEWLVWFAYPLLAIGEDYPEGWLAWLAPLLMYWVLTRASGLPPLESHMAARYGDDWREYAARTCEFFPWLPRRTAAH